MDGMMIKRFVIFALFFTANVYGANLSVCANTCSKNCLAVVSQAKELIATHTSSCGQVKQEKQLACVPSITGYKITNLLTGADVGSFDFGSESSCQAQLSTRTKNVICARYPDGFALTNVYSGKKIGQHFYLASSSCELEVRSYRNHVVCSRKGSTYYMVNTSNGRVLSNKGDTTISECEGHLRAMVGGLACAPTEGGYQVVNVGSGSKIGHKAYPFRTSCYQLLSQLQ